jgi:putative membrane protein insertion efficiency factor
MNEKRRIEVLASWRAGSLNQTPHYSITPSLHHSLNPLQRILISAIRVYRWTIPPAQIFLFGPAGGCRFTPTCSQYAMDAIGSHGALAGGWLAVRRISRCHPWGGGGHDPVPQKEFGIRHSPPPLHYGAVAPAPEAKVEESGI